VKPVQRIYRNYEPSRVKSCFLFTKQLRKNNNNNNNIFLSIVYLIFFCERISNGNANRIILILYILGYSIIIILTSILAVISKDSDAGKTKRALIIIN